MIKIPEELATRILEYIIGTEKYFDETHGYRKNMPDIYEELKAIVLKRTNVSKP